jgi:transposase
MDGPKERRTYTEEFKRQMVSLYNAGKPGSEIIREYGLTPSALWRWCKAVNATGSTRAADNRTEQERELIALRKENKQLAMENDILKQAALIFARRS